MKKSLFILVSIGFGCIFAISMAEILCRLSGFHDLSASKIQYHEILNTIYRDYNNSGEVNSDGFLTSEFPTVSNDNGTRIVVVGDSFTAGSMLPQSERFGEQLTNALGGNNVQVYNLGVDGYGTNQSLLAWSMYGARLNPTISIYNFYINDIRDNLSMQSYFTISENGITSHFGKQSWLKTLVTRVREVSAFANYLYPLAINWRYQKREASINKGSTLEVSNYVQVEQYLYSNIKASPIEREWNFMRTRLQWWTEANRVIGSVAIVVYVPARDEVDIHNRYTDIAGGFPIKNFVQSKLQHICDDVGCQFYDLTLPFVDAEMSGLQLYYKDDPHWNSKGVHHAAKLTADYVMKNVIEKKLGN